MSKKKEKLFPCYIITLNRGYQMCVGDHILLKEFNKFSNEPAGI